MTDASVASNLNQANTSAQTRGFITPEGVDLRLQIGEASQRAAAFVLDLAIIVGVLAAFTFIAVAAGIMSSLRGSPEVVAIIWLLGFFLLRNFYFATFEMTAAAATPGKRLLGLRVASRDGGRLRAEAVIGRNVMRELEVFLPISVVFAQPDQGGVEAWMYLLAFAWSAIFVFFPLFNKDRLRVGDLVGGTWVIRAPRQKLLTDMANSADVTFSKYTFTLEQLDAYGVKELHVLESVLRTDHLDTIKSVAERIGRKIGWEASAYQNDTEFLGAYYKALRGRLESRMLLGKRRADKFDV